MSGAEKHPAPGAPEIGKVFSFLTGRVETPSKQQARTGPGEREPLTSDSCALLHLFTRGRSQEKQKGCDAALHDGVNEIVAETGLSRGKRVRLQASVKELLSQLTPLRVLRPKHLSVHKVSIMAINSGAGVCPSVRRYKESVDQTALCPLNGLSSNIIERLIIVVMLQR